MNMQAMMAQAQKLQKEMEKAKQDLAEKEFTVSKGGAVTMTFTGNKEIQEVIIDKDILEPDNKDMLEEMILMCIDEALTKITEEEEKINDKLAPNMGGLF